MRLEVQVKGTEKLAKKFKALEGGLEDAIFEALVLKAFAIQSSAIRSIAKVSSGETLTLYGPKRQHTVSKPGDAPNTDTGRLISSIRVQQDKSAGIVSVGSNVEYAPWLEFGTRRMLARPWLGPAVQANKKFRKSDFKVTLKENG